MSRHQRKEARDLVRFIEAHGGKLGAFRSYRVKPDQVSTVEPAPEGKESPESGEEPPGD